MIAAIYARKSTEQRNADAEARSVAIQIANAREYATRRGWTVHEDHVYTDDGISGAAVRKLVSRQRLIDTVAGGRAPFQIVIMRNTARFSRRDGHIAFGEFNAITARGIEVEFYQTGTRWRTGSVGDEIAGFADLAMNADYRRQASRNTHEAMIGKARQGHTTGGRCFGYHNVCSVCGEVIAHGKVRCHPEGHTDKRINEAHAAVIRRIFTLSAQGLGYTSIAKRLNAEGAQAPIPQRTHPAGWSFSTVREALFRDLYRGIHGYNKTRRGIGSDGANTYAKRPPDEHVRVDRPDLRIVSDLDWQRTHARIRGIREHLQAASGGTLGHRRRYDGDSPYLFSGFLRCGECNGSLNVIDRRHYACTTNHKRGSTTCTTRLKKPIATVDAAIRAELAKVLRPAAVRAYVDGVLAALAPERLAADLTARRREVEGLDREIANYVKAIGRADDVAELVDALKDCKARRTTLAADLATAAPVDLTRFDRRTLTARAYDEFALWRAALDTGPEGRDTLRRILTGPIVVTGKGDVFEFRGELRIGQIFGEIWNHGLECARGDSRNSGTVPFSGIAA
jgi:site-specific DNA recombinase